MTLETTILTNVTAGELSPLARGRVDTEKYYNGCETLLNLVCLPQGGATKRPGTKYVIYARDSWPGPLGGGVTGGTPISSVNAVRTFDFVWGVTQAYVIETAGLGISRAITGAASNGGPGLVRLTMASTAGLFTGCGAVVSGVTGTTEANGTWTLTVIDATHVDLQGSTFSNVYVNGGTLASNGGYARFYKDDGLIVNALTVSGAANNGGGLIRLTVNSTTGVVTGNHATVSAVAGTTEANGVWILTVIDSTHIDLQGSTFTHAYTSGGVVAVPVEIAIPYTSAELPAVGYVQSTDTLYMLHPAHPAMVLTRTSHTVWAIAILEVRDGPYLTANTTATTVALSNTSGTVTATFSSTTGVNGGAGLTASDIGRPLRVKGTTWAWLKISAVTNGSVCTAIFQTAVTGGADGSISSGAATATWQLGAWSDTTGYPFLATFFQQRLFFLGTTTQANGVWGGMTNGFSSSFVTMSPTANDSTVSATNGIAWLISDDQVNAGRWMSPAGSAQTPQMGIGTVANEQILQPASVSSALSATNVQVYKETQYGARFLLGTSINTQPLLRPLRIGKSVLFVNRAGRKLYDWQFNWQVNGYIAPDLMEWSEHITDPGVVQIVYQQNPFSVLWLLRSDGQVVSATYRPDQKVFAPSRHRLGGSFSGGGAPFVESLAVIPSTDGTYDALWLAAKRDLPVPYSGGSTTITVRYIEVMANYFRQGSNGLAPEQAWFVDCGLQSTLTYPSATCTPGSRGTAGQTMTFVSSPGVFAAGSVGKTIRMNGGKAVITVYNSAGSVDALCVVPLSGTAAQTSGNWSMTAASTDFSGLTHLGTSTVSIRGDGGKCEQDDISTTGHVELATAASLVTAGLPYKPEFLTMEYETAGTGPRTAAGRVKRIIDLYLRLFETSSCRYGPAPDAPKLDQVLTRSTADLMGQAPPLLSDDFRVPMPGGSNKKGQIYATQDEADAGPFTLLGVVADVDVGQKKVAA